jgi:hypothetical protein
VPSDGATDPCLPEKIDAGLDALPPGWSFRLRFAVLLPPARLEASSALRLEDPFLAALRNVELLSNMSSLWVLLGETPRDMVLPGVPALERFILSDLEMQRFQGARTSCWSLVTNNGNAEDQHLQALHKLLHHFTRFHFRVRSKGRWVRHNGVVAYMSLSYSHVLNTSFQSRNHHTVPARHSKWQL